MNLPLARILLRKGGAENSWLHMLCLVPNPLFVGDRGSSVTEGAGGEQERPWTLARDQLVTRIILRTIHVWYIYLYIWLFLMVNMWQM